MAGPGNLQNNVITRFKSYPSNDNTRGYTVTRRTKMSHTKPKLNATNGMRTTVAKQKQQEVKMTFDSNYNTCDI